MNNDQINEQMEKEIQNDASFNLKSIRDITLSNGKRIIVYFKKDNPKPIVIHYDGKTNILDDVRERQRNNPKYQGTDAKFNTEQVLDDIALEQHSEQEVGELDGNYTVGPKYSHDVEKIKKLAALVKMANEKNMLLPFEERFAYIDEENDYVISRSGKILEAKRDVLTDEVVVQSPEAAKEYRNEELDEERLTSGELDNLGEPVTNTNEEEVSDKDIDEVYDEISIKGGSNLSKEEVAETLKVVINNPDNINNLPEKDRDWYLEAFNLLKSKKRNLKLVPPKNSNKKENNEEGVSSYVYIALIVLLIAFAVFMYFIFTR